MSAPNAGRQSPEPETQSESQVGAPTGTSGADPQGQGGEKGSEEEAGSGLESNPTHPLEESAKAKTTKEGRGEGF